MAQDILVLTDGTTRIDLLVHKQTGINVQAWRPKAPDVNATFRESPYTDGQQLVQYKLQNATENLEFMADELTANDLIASIQDTRRLLIKGLNYYVSNWINKPVWLEAKGLNETNTRYAMVRFYQLPDDEFPYGEPFLPDPGQKAIMDDMVLIIERDHWLANAPGTGECVEIGNVQDWEYSSGLFTDMGAEDDCDNETYLSNKLTTRNLTHIKIFDASGGTYTNIFPIVTFPQQLFPASPATSDIIYFGIQTSTLSPTFSSLVFDIASAMTATIVWEYWNGAAWTTLTTTTDFSNFSVTGVVSVFWVTPSSWATTAVDGITAYWVRARISAYTSGNATQQTRQIYSTVNPYFETSDVAGDIPTLARFRLENKSDFAASPSTLASTRIFCGLRSTSRGEFFSAYLDLVSTSEIVVAGLSSVDSNLSPSGKVQRYSSSTSGTLTILISDSDYVKSFYGTYRAFLRMYQSSGTNGDISISLSITTTANSPFVTSAIIPQASNNFEVLDFSQIVLGSSVLNNDEVCSSLAIQIHINNNVGASRTVDFYDLILIPTDEWAGDFISPDNSDARIKNDTVSGGRRLIDIDSIANPRRQGRSLVRTVSNDKVVAVYEYATNGSVMLQANATQRLWVFSMFYNNPDYVAKPEVGWSVQAYKNERYLSMRGSR